jgi:hypothetical protein
LKTVTVGEQKFEVRGLTRGEVKRFKADGVDFAKFSQLPDDVRETKADEVYTLVGFDVEAMDKLLYRDAQKVFSAIMEETFVTPAEEKNSESPAAS